MIRFQINDAIIKICPLVGKLYGVEKRQLKKDFGGRGVIESTEFKQADRFLIPIKINKV